MTAFCTGTPSGSVTKPLTVLPVIASDAAEAIINTKNIMQILTKRVVCVIFYFNFITYADIHVIISAKSLIMSHISISC